MEAARSLRNVGGGAGGEVSVGGKKRSSKKTEMLRHNIENKLRESLTPVAAQRALSELRPLLDELDDELLLPHSPRSINSNDTKISSNKQYHIEKHRTRRKQHQNAVILPSITSILTDHYRKQGLVAGSNNALSVMNTRKARSATNETTTLSVSRVAIPPRATSSTTELSMDRMRDRLIDFHKPSYDATAAVSIMRLERNSRKPDFSAFWNWKGEDRSIEGGGESEIGTTMKNTTIKSQVERELDDYLGHVKKKSPSTKQQEKVERLQQLKQLYFTERTTSVTAANDDDDENESGLQPLITSANYRGPADRVGVLDSLRKRLVDHQDHSTGYPSKTMGIAESGPRNHHGLTADHGGGGVLSLVHGHGPVGSLHTRDNYASTANVPVPGAPGIRTLDQPLTNHDMASVYKYFMTDDLDSSSRPGSNAEGVLPHNHKTASYQSQNGSEMLTSGGSSKQLLLPSMLPYQPQQQPITKDSLVMLQPSQSSTMPLYQPGGANSLSPTSLSTNSDNKSLPLSRKSPDTTRNGTSITGGEMGMILNMGDRAVSPLTSRTNNNVDILLDWTRSLDADMF